MIKHLADGEKTMMKMHKSTIETLKQAKISQEESLEDVVLRLLSGESKIFVDVIAVDGDYARKSPHEVIFQVGDRPARYYSYKQGNLIPIDKLPIKVEMQRIGAFP